MFDLYVVTDAGLSKGRSDHEVARLAYEGGADAVQLRMKNADGGPMLKEALRSARRRTRCAGSSWSTTGWT